MSGTVVASCDDCARHCHLCDFEHQPDAVKRHVGIGFESSGRWCLRAGLPHVTCQGG